MQLSRISYHEFDNDPRRWILLNLDLGAKNLLVGKNASGKTRTINVISGLSKILAGKVTPFASGDYDCTFQNNKSTLRYAIRFHDKTVAFETLEIDGKTLLLRDKNGFGRIYSEHAKQEIPFQSPTSMVAAVARRDTIHHNFLELLYEWALSVVHFEFSKSDGKDMLHMQISNTKDNDESDLNTFIHIFKAGINEFGDRFKTPLIADLNELGYDIDNIDTGKPITIQDIPIPGIPLALTVKERSLDGCIDHLSMSQGMFRVLSLLINIHYFKNKNKTSCLLIDDIGEGLDFERACTAIDILRKRAEEGNAQLIMSTNDRFVMNSVPLEEWSIIQRKGCVVSTKNYSNSKNAFEEFKYTGLSNFSFFEFDMVNASSTDENAPNE